jgi:hypothetical protein
MTPETFNTEAFEALANTKIVYVRPILASQALSHMQVPEEEAISLDPNQIVYAVHRGNGEPLAVISDHDTAFALAHAHGLDPFSVH